jgi:formyl-CoA transferase
MWANSYLIQAHQAGAPHPPRPPRDESISALGNIYRTRDGRWFMLAVANDRQWPALARAIEHPELLQDTRFAGPRERRDNAVALMRIFDAAFARRDLGDWREALDAAGLTFGIVGTTDEIAHDPQAMAAGFLRPLADTGMLTVDSPFTITDGGKVPVRLAPGHGEHSRQILAEAGYGAAEIEALIGAGAVGEGGPLR